MFATGSWVRGGCSSRFPACGARRDPRQCLRRVRSAALEGRTEGAPHPRCVHPLARTRRGDRRACLRLRGATPWPATGTAVAPGGCVARRCGPGRDGPPVDQRPSAEWEREHARLLLVCTNGRHDQCCANLGRPLVRALRESQWATQVWECSHIGGDRFAPNLVVLPDSLYFGRVEPESASSILSALDDGRIEVPRFRGRTCFSLAEQAVEHFVRRELAIDAIDGVVIESQAADGSFLVKLQDRR